MTRFWGWGEGWAPWWRRVEGQEEARRVSRRRGLAARLAVSRALRPVEGVRSAGLSFARRVALLSTKPRDENRSQRGETPGVVCGGVGWIRGVAKGAGSQQLGRRQQRPWATGSCSWMLGRSGGREKCGAPRACNPASELSIPLDNNVQGVSFSEARERLAVRDRVEADADVTLLTRRHGKGAVVMSLDTRNSLMEPVHLLRSPANAAHQRRSLEQAGRGERLEHGMNTAWWLVPTVARW